MRFALFTDQHFGPPAYFGGKLRKLSHEAARLTRELVRQLNEELRPDLVINLGDVIEDESHDADLARYREFLGIVAGLDAPVLHVAGNHDTLHVAVEELCALWGESGGAYRSRDVAGVHFAALHSLETKDRSVNLPAEQLDWLRADLAATSLPAIVLVHHPASELRLDGNRWFEHAPHICRIAERRQLRRVISDSGKVLAVFNGHAHWNHLDLCDGVPYVTLQSLTENLDDDAPGRAARAFALCDLDDRRLLVHVHGEETLRYQFERRSTAG